MPHDAFISFSSKDVDAAAKICLGLETRGIACWMSTRDVPPGADFQESIIDALEAAHVMVLVFSANANNSGEMKKELVLAGDYKLPVLPVRIEKVIPSGAFRYQLTTRQYLDLFEDWDANLAKLANQIERIVARQPVVPSEGTPEPVPELVEISLWNSVKDSQEPCELEDYLHQFPHGSFAQLAQHRLASLRQRAGGVSQTNADAGLATEKNARPPEPPRAPGKQPTPSWFSKHPAGAAVLVVIVGLLAGVYALHAQFASSQSESAPASASATGPGLLASSIPSVGWLGIVSFAYTPDKPLGIVVSSVGKNSPAAEAGVAPGDLVVAFDGKPVDPFNWRLMVADRPPGTKLVVSLQRAGKAMDIPVVIGNLRAAAEQGNSAAIAGVGYALLSGYYGVTKDEVEGLRWMRKAADLGDPTAMLLLGSALEFGHGVAPDLNGALNWYRKAADRGEARAMTSIGRLYRYGRGVDRSPAEALPWYRKAAGLGDPIAMGALGDFYYFGTAVPSDYTEALSWYRKAAGLGNPVAMTSVGLMYRYGNGVTQNYPEALSWFRKAADLGDSQAMTYTGMLLEHGLGTPPNVAEALRWYRKGADLGDPQAMSILGTLYLTGKGVDQDYGQALAWFHKGADLGDATAMFKIGVCYGKGQGVVQNDTEALTWFHKAADLGNTAAIASIGVHYEAGWGVAKDDAEALRWYLRAANMSDAFGARKAALLLADGRGAAPNMTEATRWMRFAAEQGDVEAKKWLDSQQPAAAANK